MAREVAGDYLIAHFAQNTVERKALRQAGFLQAPRQGITFTVRPLQTSMPEITAPTSWDLTLGDLELF
jgi:hypothetical protein